MQELKINNRIIWCLRDPRSGSTWFLFKLASKLTRTQNFLDIENNHIFSLYPQTSYYMNNEEEEKKKRISNFFKNRKQTDRDQFTLISTHEYSALESMSNYKDPILFRNVRRDKTQQFASLVVANTTNYYNVHSIENRNKLPTLSPFTVDEQRIRSFIDRVKEADKLWNTYATQYESEVVYYEDLLEGWESKIIDFQAKMLPDDDTALNKILLKNILTVRNPERFGLPLKLPYKYEEILTNFDYIDKTLREELGPY